MEIRRKLLFCLRNEVLAYLWWEGWEWKKKKNPKPSNSFNDWTLKIYDSIDIMPMPGLQLSGLAAGVGLGGLEDAIQSSASMTHCSEITENVGILWTFMLSVRGKQYTASRSCSIEYSYVDWMIKINERNFPVSSLTNHRVFFSLFSPELKILQEGGKGGNPNPEAVTCYVCEC